MDNILEILIKFGLSKEKATEAVAELKKIEDQTKATGKEGVKAEKEVTAATKETFTSTFIPAGTLWALQVTNQSASSRQIYGDWSVRYFAQ